MTNWVAAFGCVLAGLGWVLWTYGNPFLTLTAWAGTTVLPWSTWIPIQATAAVRLLGLFLLPIGQTVDYDYDFVTLPIRYACVLILALPPSLAYRLRREPLIAFGLAWALIAIAPRLLVQTPRSYFSEHQFYVPVLGLALCGAACWDARRGA